MIDRYLIAVGRDEAEIILCTAANGKQLKLSLFHSRGKCGHQVELSEPKNRMYKNASFMKAHLDCIQVGFFCPIKGNCLRCRSPPLVLQFLDLKNHEMEDKPMAEFEKKINYRKKYPGLSNEILCVLEKSDRKMEYQQYDLKVERYRIDYAKGTVTYLPSREDSFERLLEENKQFADDAENVEDTAVNAVMIEKMLKCLKLLSPEEQELISELFFKGKSEHQLARQTGIAQRTIHDRKVKILGKLKKLLDK